MTYENVEFTRHCKTCASVYQKTDASPRFCSITCEETSTLDNRKCPNCGLPISGSNRKEFCSRSCKQRHNKRKFYPVKGNYRSKEQSKESQKLRNAGEAESEKDWIKRKIKLKRIECAKRGIICTMTVDDLVPVTHCPILGIELKYPPQKFEDDRGSAPSIDRIIPSLGYVSGNVRIISFRANSLKNSATAEEAILLAVDALKYLPSDHPWHLQPPWE